MPSTQKRHFQSQTSFWLAIVSALIVIPIFSQTPGASRPSFEVASIKPYADPGAGPRFFGFRGEPGGTRIAMTGVTVKMLITYAYRIRDFQIIGGPDWINSERYDIQAKAEDGSIPPPTGPPDPSVPDPMGIRTQSLLDDRFQLKMHRETRELPVYELVLAKGGSRMILSEDQNPPQPRKPGDPLPPPPQRGAPPGRGGLFIQRTPSGFTMEATSVPLSNFIGALSQQVGRTVIDKTDLKAGLYDIKLEWTDNGPAIGPPPPGADTVAPPAEPSGPSVFTAIQEQLGLRLVSSKGPVDVFIIDGVQKPTAN
jgi:uncharacterized protein (TIGR03435 family)